MADVSFNFHCPPLHVLQLCLQSTQLAPNVLVPRQKNILSNTHTTHSMHIYTHRMVRIRTCIYTQHCCGFESHPGKLIFLLKNVLFWVSFAMHLPCTPSDSYTCTVDTVYKFILHTYWYCVYVCNIPSPSPHCAPPKERDSVIL